MDLIVVKKDELVKAYQRWNIEVINNPTGHTDPNDTIEDAVIQVDEMVKYITEGHIEEEIAFVKTNTVSSFMEHCNSEGLHIPDKYFESYFEA